MEKNHLQIETTTESWASEAVMGFKRPTWVASEEWGKPALQFDEESVSPLAESLKLRRKHVSLLTELPWEFPGCGAGKKAAQSYYILQLFRAETLCFFNTMFILAAVGSKPPVDPGIHSTSFPETHLLNEEWHLKKEPDRQKG